MSIGTGLITVPMLIDRLSDRYYGLWVALQDMANFSQLAIGGMGAFFIREMVHLSSRSDEIRPLSERSFGIQFFLGGIVSSALGGCLWIFLQNLRIPADQQIPPSEAAFLSAVIALNIWRAFCIEPLSACLRANLQWGVLSGIQMTQLVLRSFILFLLLQHGDSLLKLALLVAMVDSFFAFVLYFAVRVSFPSFLFRPKLPSYRYLKDSFVYGLNASFVTMFVFLFFYLDTVIIAYIMGPTVLSHASIPQQMTLYFVMLSSVFCEVLFVFRARSERMKEGQRILNTQRSEQVPISDGLNAEIKSYSWGIQLLWQRTWQSTPILSPEFCYACLLGALGATLMLFAGPFVQVWIGQDAFVQATETMIIPMVAVSMILTLSHQIPMSHLLATKQPTHISKFLVLELVLKCAIAVGATMQWGIMGLFAANILVALVFNSLLVSYWISRHSDVARCRPTFPLLCGCVTSTLLTYYSGNAIFGK